MSDNYFEITLKDVGINLSESDEHIILNQEPSLIIRDMEKYFNTGTNSNGNIENIVKGLQDYIENEEHLLKVLSNTFLHKTCNDAESTAIKIQQESIFKILLNVYVLQPKVIDVILEQITTYTSNESESTGCLRLLINTLRYLPYIQDSTILTTKLLDILEISSYPCQLEILNSLPEILPDSQYDTTATQLTKLLSSNPDLTGAILDCLNAFSLNSNVRSEVQLFIMDNLLTCSTNEIFPILFQFLVTDCKQENLQLTLFKCRNSLDSIMSLESTESNAETNKALVLNKLNTCASIPKQLYEGWIGMISSIRTSADHKPIDIFILIVLYTAGSVRKKNVESQLKKRVKTGLFKISLLENLFKKYISIQFLNDYIAALIEIGLGFLRHHNDMNMIEFGSQFIKLLFCHELTHQIHCQDILHNLILLTGSCDQKTVGCVLNLLTDLSKNSKLKRHTIQLMSLLEKLDTYEIHDIKKIFELLCYLTCGPHADDAGISLKDEIHMLIRKQLSSSKKLIKMKGIVSAVILAKYIANVEEDQSEVSISEESMMSIGDLPKGPAQDAARILELTNTCSSVSAEFMGLYYDQLASMVVTEENCDKFFMAWMFETITNDFQDVFVTETVPNFLNEIPISSQYSLNSNEEVDVPISINIAELTIYQGEKSILILAPLFRLLRLLHYQHQNGNLTSIDALLGCGVVMPTIVNIHNFDIDQTKQIADCLFHCINWFREIISAFVSQKIKKLRQKVIERLSHIIQLEGLLSECMKIIPDHKLPSSYFHNAIPKLANKVGNPVKSPRPKKKFKSRPTVADADATIASTSAVTNSTRASASPTKYIPKEHFDFRELDIDIILLLKYSLNLDGYDPPLAQSTQSATQTVTTISTKQFQFLMADFVAKLNILTKNNTRGLSTLNAVNPVDLITDSLRLLPCIHRHFESVNCAINKILLDNEGDDESSTMFTIEVANLKLCFNLVLECFSLIFGWTGFQNPKHLNLLRDCLRSMRTNEQSQLNSANRLIVEFANKISCYSDQCLYLPSAVNLIIIMQSLYKINMSPEIQTKIVTTSGKLLTRSWKNLKGNSDSGKLYQNNIEIITKAYLNGAAVKTICGLVATLQNQVMELNNREDRLPMLQSFEKVTFYILFRCLCTALLEKVKTEIISLTNNQHLILWKTTALTMQGLMTIAKVHETRANLVCFLKKSLGVLKIFLTHGIPILEIMLRSKTDSVIEIFKAMQTTTRFLHHLCCYSKITKDSSLITFVPQFRLTLETLVYRVKAALVANNCSAAFWMGNLRNKNIHGEDICSQSTVVTETNDKNSDEELPSDDSENESFHEEVTSNTDASEVFD